MISAIPARTKHSAINGRIGYPPVVGVVTAVIFKAHPASAATPRVATSPPAMMGILSTKPISGL
jgi:hypothetical protein